jgi:hypothetical protein
VAAWLPAGAQPPSSIAGFPVRVTTRADGLAWVASLPEVTIAGALSELAQALRSSGAAAVVAVGPLPSRECGALVNALADVPLRPARQSSCALADGATEIVRGAPERLELELAAPALEDERFSLLAGLEAWLQQRLSKEFRGLRVELVQDRGCGRLAIRAPCDGVEPRVALRHLRQRLADLAVAPIAGAEIAEIDAVWAPRIARLAGDGSQAATEIVEVLAYGGRVASWLAQPQLEPAGLAELVRAVLRGHSGRARLVESERRSRPTRPESLENGAFLTVTGVNLEAGVVATALACEPTHARTVLDGVAANAARAGWPATVSQIAGVHVLTVIAPGAAVIDALEDVAVALREATTKNPDPHFGEAARRLGISELVRADTVSVALAMPLGVEEGEEAAQKFFGVLAKAEVQTLAVPPPPGPTTVGEAEQVRVLALIELSPGANTWVVAEILEARLRREPGLDVRWLAPPGRHVLVLAAAGSELGEVEKRLTKLWTQARQKAVDDEVTRASRRVMARLFGDLAQAMARAAAAPLLPGIPTQAELLAVSTRDVNVALEALGPLEGLPRLIWQPRVSNPATPVAESPTPQPNAH